MARHSTPSGQRQPWDLNLPMLVQASYYLVTGLWPLAHMRSFEALTGPKPDRFVVESTGLLFATAGATLAAAAADEGAGRPARILSALLPAASTLATLRHRPQLRAVYVVDAVVQTALAAWVWRHPSSSGETASSAA